MRILSKRALAKWIRYLIALVVGSHGLVYLNVVRGWFPGMFAGWMGISLVLGNTLTGDSLKALILAVWLIAGIGLICAGVTILFTPSMPGLWRPLTVGASLLGILGFVFFWDGQTQLLVDQGLIGAILSLVILSGTIASWKSSAKKGILRVDLGEEDIKKTTEKNRTEVKNQ